jgi:hypothetical protein
VKIRLSGIVEGSISASQSQFTARPRGPPASSVSYAIHVLGELVSRPWIATMLRTVSRLLYVRELSGLLYGSIVLFAFAWIYLAKTKRPSRIVSSLHSVSLVVGIALLCIPSLFEVFTLSTQRGTLVVACNVRSSGVHMSCMLIWLGFPMETENGEAHDEPRSAATF